MDSFFAKSQLNVTRFFARSMGLWPLQNSLQKIIYFSIAQVFIISQAYFQFGGCISAQNVGDTETMLQSIPPIIVDFMCAAKILNAVINSNKIKKLLTQIHDTWDYFLPEEKNILEKYANISRTLTVYYAYGIYGIMVPFLILPIYPILNNLMSPSKLIPLQLMFHVEYFLDTQNYYYLLLIHSYIGTFVYITMVIALDSMYIVFVQHACGMFSALRHRLQRIVPKEDTNIELHPSEEQDKSYQTAVDCISLHNMIIEFSDLIESAYTFGFLFVVGFNMVVISFTAFEALENLHIPSTMVRYASFTVVQIIHLYFECWQTQELMDHSLLIQNSIYNTDWYKMSPKTKQILCIMLIRSSKICKVTAGKFFEMSSRTFSVVIRASASYFTVLTSVR